MRASLSILIGFLAVLSTSCERKTQMAKHEPPPQTQAMNWRSNPLLKDRLLKDYPDDLQVIVHDGGPRLTQASPELIWARITAVVNENTFVATVLNKPSQLTKVRERDSITFMVKEKWEHPVQVRDDYLRERSSWIISPCEKCGFDELFDAPSLLISVIFPTAPSDAKIEAFTSFCPLCRRVQTVRDKNSDLK